MEHILPVEATVGFPPAGLSTKDMYEKMGIKILKNIGKNKYNALLPNEWKIMQDHDDIYYLYDDEQRVRAWLHYYKSDKPLVAFQGRYKRQLRKTDRKDIDEFFGVILDGGKDEIFRTKLITSKNLAQVEKKLFSQLNEFLDTNFPEWKTNGLEYIPNTDAYWEYKH